MMSQVVKNGGVGTSPSIDKINKMPSNKLISAAMRKSVFSEDTMVSTGLHSYPMLKIDFSDIKMTIESKVKNVQKAAIQQQQDFSNRTKALSQIEQRRNR